MSKLTKTTLYISDVRLGDMDVHCSFSSDENTLYLSVDDGDNVVTGNLTQENVNDMISLLEKFLEVMPDE